jgi:hypothetical protein
MYYQWKVFEKQEKDTMMLGRFLSPSIYYAVNGDLSVKINTIKTSFAGGKYNAVIFSSNM